VKLIQEVWNSNDLESWLIAAAIMTAVLIVLATARFVATRIASAIAQRTSLGLAGLLEQVIRGTKLWLLLPLAFYAGASALELPDKAGRLIDALAVLGLMLQAAIWINRFIQGGLQRKIEERRGVDGESVTALTLLGFGARVLVWTLVLLLVLDHLGFNITALVTGLGIGGVAIALAVQNILGDLFASLSIVLDKPFVVGDFVVIENLRGNVEQIGIKTTRIRSLDGELIVFSNADLLKSRIRNFKRMQERRLLFGFGVTYQTPADKLERIPAMVKEIIENKAHTRFDRAHFKEYGDSSLNFEVVYHVLKPEFGFAMDIQQAINLELFRRFAAEGIDFAYPTRTLYVNNAAPAAA
jgi:small-conductance mechanosensitive channel